VCVLSEINEGAEMKRLLIVLVLLALLVVPVPVMAIQCDFQDYGGCNFGAVSPTTFDNYNYGTGVEIRGLRLIGGVGSYVTQTNPSPSNYWGITIISVSNPAQTYTMFYDSFRTQIAGHQINLGAGRYEFFYDSTNSHLYVYNNGIYHADLGATVGSVPPSYMDLTLVGGGSIVFDDYTNLDPDANDVYISTIPVNFTVIKDFITPASSGLYAESTLVRTNYMYSYWSNTTNGSATQISKLKNVATDTVYETLGTGNFNAEIRTNLSVLTAPTATAPNGLYKITIEGSSSPFSAAYFWLTSTGASILWDKDKYYTDENSVSTWSVTPAYWDTTTYSYEGAIVDVYGSTKKSWTITAASGTEHTTMSSSTYPQGVYYNKITATMKASPFTAYILDTDYTEVSQDIKISGITYNATTNSTQPSVFINFTQTGVGTVNTTSFPITGTYNKTGFVSGSAITIEPFHRVNYQPLQFVPVSFTPLSYGNFTVNLYGTSDPKNQTGTNSTIYGLVQSSPYYNSLGGATVSLWNATYEETTRTNATGFYNFTSLRPFTEYSMNASYLGYTNTSNEVVNSSSYYKTVLYNATRKDFLLSTTFNITVTITDSETHDPIPGATVTATDGFTSWSSTSSSIGVAYFDLPYGLYSITASSGGYYASTSSHIVDADDTVSITLTPLFQQSSILQDYPHYVTFRTMKLTGGGIPDVAVTAQGYMTSTGNYDWLIDWIGIPIEEAPIHNTTMSALTDDYGAVTFLMVPTVKYNMTFTLAGYTFSNLRLMPQDNEYIIYPEGQPEAVFYPVAGMSELEAVNITITTADKTSSIKFVNISYYDKLGHTTGGYVDVLLKNETPFGRNFLLYCWTVSEQKNPWTGAVDLNNWTNSSEVDHTVAVSGFVNTNVTNTDFGFIKRSFGFSFFSIPVTFLGFGYEIALLVAMGIMLFTAMLGGASNAKQVAFVVCIEGWVFYSMHWYDSLIARGVPAEVISMALLIATVFAFVANMGVRKRKEKY
jgi:hypothetical protein